jgi:hypothetical protein
MYTGPHIKRDGLVFGYDTGYGIADNRAETRFYPGEPTTNILPSPENNGRFTTANGWASYNTNQYNGNNDFDIGTIGSISNNIVTLSSVGHNIRSFDVLNPATTGGGVVAGTNYVIKKLSSTTFSLHAYNGSQNGSQGYINPDTGFFKVHDAYANDTRVSISASGFPEMWHGAPHLPNSGLIKEIVPNGGYVKGTNCMRFHVYRGDGVADGMAYNVYCPVTQGDIITVSYWARPVGTLGYGKNLGYSTYFGGGNSAPGFGTNLNSDGEWQLITHTWTASATVNFYSYFWPQGSTDKYAIDIADMQVEVNRGHATPFTLTSRSNTASLIDLKRTTDIDVSNVSFDSTGQPTFDGTDDEIELAANDWNKVSAVTIEAIVSINGAPIDGNDYHVVVQKDGAYSGGAVYGIRINNSSVPYGTFSRGSSSSDTHVNTVAGNTMTSNKYYHLVYTRKIGESVFYQNGVQETINTSNNDAIYNNTDTVTIGQGDGRQLYGDIPIVKIYNRVLSAEEVKQNFNAYKNRFGI